MPRTSIGWRTLLVMALEAGAAAVLLWRVALHNHLLVRGESSDSHMYSPSSRALCVALWARTCPSTNRSSTPGLIRSVPLSFAMH